MTDKDMLALIEYEPRLEYVGRSIELYCASDSWRIANYRTGLITSLALLLTDRDIRANYEIVSSKKGHTEQLRLQIHHISFTRYWSPYR